MTTLLIAVFSFLAGFISGIIFIVVMAINLVLIGASLTNKDKDLEFTYFLPFFLFIGVIIPMLMGVKKINQELKRREDK